MTDKRHTGSARVTRDDGHGTTSSPAASNATAGRAATFISSPAGVAVLCLTSCLLWGSAFPCVKIAYRLFSVQSGEVASQWLLAGVRFFLAGVMVICAVSIFRRKLLIPKRADWPAIIALSLAQTTVQYSLFYVGLAHATGVASSIIEGAEAFIAVLIASLLLHQERLTTRKIAGCIIGFAGIVVINLGGGAGTGGISFEGEGLVLLSTIAAAVSTCLIRRFSQKHDAVLLSGWQFLVGGLTLIVLSLICGGSITPSGPDALALLIYMGFISAAAYSLWSLCLSANSVSHVAVYSFMIPVFGVILSAIWLGEASVIDPLRTVCALVLVSLGILILNRAPKED